MIYSGSILDKRDDHQREGIDDGAAGGRGGAAGGVELERGPGGAEFPHAQRLLLQSERRVQLFRREGSEGGIEQGAGAVLSNGGEAPARRRRSRGD